MTLEIDASIRACRAGPQVAHIRFRVAAGHARPRSDQTDQGRASWVRRPISAEFTCVAVYALFRTPRSRLVHNDQLLSSCRPPDTKQIDAAIVPPLPDIPNLSLLA